VNPASMVYVGVMNKAPPGSYHSGKEGDVTAVQLDKAQDMQFVATMIDRYEKQISQAFLLGSQLRRQAERVTAEEIRGDAQELEQSNGGIYSRLAATWQGPTARIVLDATGFIGLQDGIQPKIITGMDSLSRAGELDNIRMFMMDMAMLNNVPEAILAEMDLAAFITLIGTNRQIDYKKILLTIEQKQQRIKQQADAIAAQQGMENSGKVQTAAATQAMKEG